MTEEKDWEKVCPNCTNYHLDRNENTVKIYCDRGHFDFFDTGNETFGGKGVQRRNGNKKFSLNPVPCGGRDFDPNEERIERGREVFFDDYS